MASYGYNQFNQNPADQLYAQEQAMRAAYRNLLNPEVSAMGFGAMSGGQGGSSTINYNMPTTFNNPAPTTPPPTIVLPPFPEYKPPAFTFPGSGQGGGVQPQQLPQKPQQPRPVQPKPTNNNTGVGSGAGGIGGGGFGPYGNGPITGGTTQQAPEGGWTNWGMNGAGVPRPPGF